jgi:hypothetical protein
MDKLIKTLHYVHTCMCIIITAFCLDISSHTSQRDFSSFETGYLNQPPRCPGQSCYLPADLTGIFSIQWIYCIPLVIQNFYY